MHTALCWCALVTQDELTKLKFVGNITAQRLREVQTHLGQGAPFNSIVTGACACVCACAFACVRGLVLRARACVGVGAHACVGGR